MLTLMKPVIKLVLFLVTRDKVVLLAQEHLFMNQFMTSLFKVQSKELKLSKLDIQCYRILNRELLYQNNNLIESCTILKKVKNKELSLPVEEKELDKKDTLFNQLFSLMFRMIWKLPKKKFLVPLWAFWNGVMKNKLSEEPINFLMDWVQVL